MSRRSILRDRRSAQSSDQSFLVFQLGSEQFAISLFAVQKVSTLGKVFGDPQRSGISLTLHEGQELAVVDVQRRILNRPTSDLTDTRQPDVTAQFLLVVQNSRQDMMGLPIDSKPKIQSFPEQSLKSLPAAYQNDAAIQCVSNLVIQEQDQPIFLLNPELICQSLNPNYTPAESVSQEQLTELEQFLQAPAALSQTPVPQPAIASEPPAEMDAIDWMNLPFDTLDLPDAPAMLEDLLPSEAPSEGFQTPESAIAFNDSEAIDWSALPLEDFEPPIETSFSSPSPESVDSEVVHPTTAIAVNGGEAIDWSALPLGDFEPPVEAAIGNGGAESFDPSPQLFPAVAEPLDWNSLPLDGFEIPELLADGSPSENQPEPTPEASEPMALELNMPIAAIDVPIEGESFDWGSLPLDNLNAFIPD
jgi:chemotaxis signal transduction protein